ncbi:aminoglycoside phosphotransferase family protein [Frateuria hangzhouensis]|uniref:aminoglycoside phosphotransferase family protein n=1 Tax=Frateuria hangzhouensis TaxID=2995589 RepID=UPI002260CD52|nr:phosphotransferase [Frateuria sp. STR12]MCX7514875.1 phosphotransferase [Frateuria sp. STR12]
MTTAPDRAVTRLAWARATLGDTTLTLEPASSDASFRSYWRTQSEGTSWIVMDSPPALEDPAPWLAIGERLRAAGLHAPAVLAHDLAQGFLLIEDLGRQPYLPALADDTVDALYGQAMDALLRLQTRVDGTDLPPYNHAFLQRELELMPEWFLQRHLGYTPECEEWDVIEQAFTVLLHNAAEQPRVFVHRDFHSRNLMLVGDAAAGGRGLPCLTPLLETEPAPQSADRVPLLRNPGIIDFQGALHGPLAYDLASLLRDCYIAWDEARITQWVEQYRQRALQASLLDAAVDTARFRRWVDLIGLQRHLKVLGIFCRLWYRDGKRGYLADLPRVLGYVLDVARRYPELADFAALIERCIGDRDITKPATA